MRQDHRRARSLTAALGVAGLLLTAGAVAPPAQAGDVGSARARVAAMQAKVAAVAATLTKGTRAYDAGARHLAEVQRQERAARRQAAQIRAAATAERRKLDGIAAAAYRNPVPGVLAAAVTGGRDEFATALVAKADLEHVSGSEQDVLRQVVAARVRADNATRRAEQLSADARATERRLSRQLASLRATADRAERELQAAADQLASAEAAEQARLAAARRAARTRRVSDVVGATCQGSAGVGYANGFMPASALCPLWGASGQELRWDAAAAFNRMSQARAAATGAPLCVTDSYRPYSRQVSVYQRKPGMAATPGTSEHGWGLAVDLCGGVEHYGSEAYDWMKANAGAFGFHHPSWAEPGTSQPEPWHWEFAG